MDGDAKRRLLDAAARAGNPHRMVAVSAGDILAALQESAQDAGSVVGPGRKVGRSIGSLGLDGATIEALTANGLTDVAAIEAVGDLTRLPGIGKVRAAKVLAAVRTT